MLKEIINKIKKLYKIKFRLDLPNSKKILIFDEVGSLILKDVIKKDFSILKVRDEKEIYFWIFLKQIIFFDFKFMTYCKNYIEFTSPKIIITFIDNNTQFYELKNFFKNIHFISIQNGHRSKQWFKITNTFSKSKNLKCNHFFVYNKYYKKEFQKIIKSKYYILGNLKNNSVEVNKNKTHKQFLYISQYRKNNEKRKNLEKKLLNFINLFLSKFNKKLHILVRSKNSLEQKEEIDYYKKISQSSCIFQKTFNWKKTYEILDKFENIIFAFSSLGYEAIARKKKVAIFSPTKFKHLEYYTTWNAFIQKRCDFFLAKKLNYNEIKRVLTNLNSCSQANWEKKYYSVIKDQLYLNKNNIILRKVLSKLL